MSGQHRTLALTQFKCNKRGNKQTSKPVASYILAHTKYWSNVNNTYAMFWMVKVRVRVDWNPTKLFSIIIHIPVKSMWDRVCDAWLLGQVGTADTQPSGQQADAPSCPEVKWITVSQSALPFPPQDCFSTARGHLPCGCDLWPQPLAPPPGSVVEDWRMLAVLSGNGWRHSSTRALGEKKSQNYNTNKVEGLCLTWMKGNLEAWRSLMAMRNKSKEKNSSYIFMPPFYSAPCRKL